MQRLETASRLFGDRGADDELDEDEGVRDGTAERVDSRGRKETFRRRFRSAGGIDAEVE